MYAWSRFGVAQNPVEMNEARRAPPQTLVALRYYTLHIIFESRTQCLIGRINLALCLRNPSDATDKLDSLFLRDALCLQQPLVGCIQPFLLLGKRLPVDKKLLSTNVRRLLMKPLTPPWNSCAAASGIFFATD